MVSLSSWSRFRKRLAKKLNELPKRSPAVAALRSQCGRPHLITWAPKEKGGASRRFAEDRRQCVLGLTRCSYRNTHTQCLIQASKVSYEWYRFLVHGVLVYHARASQPWSLFWIPIYRSGYYFLCRSGKSVLRLQDDLCCYHPYCI